MQFVDIFSDFDLFYEKVDRKIYTIFSNLWYKSWSVLKNGVFVKILFYPRAPYEIHIGSIPTKNGETNPPIVPNTIPREVTVDLIGVGKSSAAIRNITVY